MTAAAGIVSRVATARMEVWVAGEATDPERVVANWEVAAVDCMASGHGGECRIGGGGGSGGPGFLKSGGGDVRRVLPTNDTAARLAFGGGGVRRTDRLASLAAGEDG